MTPQILVRPKSSPLIVPTRSASSVRIVRIGVRGAPEVSGSTPHTETPVGAIDGSNTVFTISVTPTQLILTLNGLAQDIGTDFTRSGATITFVHAPHVGDIIIAFFLT